MPPHVMICALENHSYSQVIGNSNFPHINALASAYGNCTNYFAVTHQSLPNYMAIASGDDQCVEDAQDPAKNPLAGNTIADSLDAVSIGWKHYAENLPSAGYLGGDTGGYTQHHDPWVYFKTFRSATAAYQQAHLVNYSNFSTDLAAGTVPPFVFIQPNNTDNGHTGTDTQCDNWVNSFVTLVQGSSWYAGGGIIILWFDESHPDSDKAGIGDKGCSSTYPGGGKTVCIVISAANSGIAAMTSNINSYGILRGIETLYALPYLLKSGHTINGDLSPLLKTTSPPPPPPPPPAGFTVTPLAFNYTATVGGANPPAFNLSLQNTGGFNGTWAVVFSGGSWLSAASTSGSLAAGAATILAMSASISGLSAATYTETATFTFTPTSGPPIVVVCTATLFLGTTPPPPPPPPPPPSVSPLGDGFTFTVPADTTLRTLLVDCDVDRGVATFAASLSDRSFPDYYDSSLSNTTGVSAGQYALSYQAGSSGKLLTVTYVLEKGLSTGVLVSTDTYTRANQSGLGTSSDGETYSLVSEAGAPAWSIVSNQGQMAGSTGTIGIALLGTHTIQDGEVHGIVTLSNLANSGGFVMRATVGAASYYAALLTQSSIQLIYVAGGDAIVLTNQPVTLKSATGYLLRFRIAKNCLWARSWPNDGKAEPKNWQAFAVDSHLTQAGLSGLRGALATSTDSVLFDNYGTSDFSAPGDPSSVSLYSAALAGTSTVGVGKLPGQVFVNGVSNYIFGTNMSTDFATNTVRNTAAIQSQILAAGFTVMRCAIPNGSTNAYIDLTASACVACGCAMLVILSSTDNTWNQSLVTYLGSRCLLYEFGNEPDLGGVSESTYLANWNSFIPVLRGINPQAAFIGPALGVFANVNSYLVPWLQGCVTSGVMPDGISYHVYPCTSATCDQTCCTPKSGNFERDAATLRAAIATVTPTAIPICLTEWNIDASNPQKAYTQANPFNTTWTEAAMDSMVAGHLDMACQWDAAGNAGGGTDDLISTQSPYPQQIQYAPIAFEIAKYLGGGISPPPPPVGGALSVVTSTPTGTISLTPEGSGDWAHWGFASAFAYDHKAGVTRQISNFTAIGSGVDAQDSATLVTYAWTDGTPTGSATTTTGCIVAGVGNGFYLTAPADTTTRTLNLYVEAKLAQGQLSVTLSDGSAAASIDTSLNDTGGSGSVRKYAITYNAASPGQTLTVQWTMLMDNGTPGGLTTYSTDTMTRPNQTNWGTGSGGETWVKTDVVGTTQASIVSNMGQVTATSGSPSEVALYGTQIQANAESYVEWEVSSVADQPGLVLRATATNTFYRACVTGGNTLELDRNVAGKVNMLKNLVIAISPNTLYAMRFRIDGSNYYVKHWLKSGAEPAGWSIVGTDGGATAITGAGQWGIRTRVNASGDTISYQNFSVTNFGTGGGGTAGSIGLHAATMPAVVVVGPPPPPPPPGPPPPPSPPPAPVVAVVVNASNALPSPFLGFGVEQDPYTQGTWIVNGSFEDVGGSPAYTPWVFQVTGPAVATAALDSTTFDSGTNSLKVAVTTADASNHFHVQVYQGNIGILNGSTYTVTFWAKASVARAIDVVLQQQASPNTLYSQTTETLSTSWQQFTITYTATASDTVFLGFNLAASTGTVWLDTVAISAIAITSALRATINSRLAYMNPSIIRTAAAAVSWWCPSGVVGTYDFTNALMQEWYAVFERAQAQGTAVIVSVNSPAPFALLSSSWCTAFADLLDYLINTRGYTCIQYVSGLSEPDTAGSGIFTVLGNTIYDPNNAAYRVKGVDMCLGRFAGGDVSGYGLTNYNNFSRDVGIFKGLGGNTIRLSLNVNGVNAAGSGAGGWTEVDTVITTATSRGLVVIVSQTDSSDTTTQISTWLTALAARYATNPYVWIKPANEPTHTQSWSDWQTQEQAWVNAIRAGGNTAPIVLNCNGYSWSWGQYPLHPITDTKLILGPHRYANGLTSFDATTIDWAYLSQFFPVLMDEVGNEDSTPTDESATWNQQFLQFIAGYTNNNNGVGCIAFTWYWSDDNKLVDSTGTFTAWGTQYNTYLLSQI